MFVIELIYKADLKEIDARMRAHMAFLKKHYADGKFLVSGRKIPRDGGIILALGESRDEIEAIMKRGSVLQARARGLSESSSFARANAPTDIPQRIEGS